MRGLILIFCLSAFLLSKAQTDDNSASDVRILSLEECIEIAIQNNITVRRGKLNLESSRADLLQSKGALLPDANLFANYGFNWGRSIDPTTNLFRDQEIQRSGAGGSSSVVLYRGRSLMNTVNQSKAAMEANQYGLEFSQNTVMLNIITFYLNVIFNRELVENSRFQLESSQQQLDRTTKLVEAGSLPITSQLELQSQVASNEVQLINNENLLNLAVLNLKQAMLIPASTPIDIIVPNLDNVDVQTVRTKSADQIFETALSTQPEIKNAELNVESSVYALKAAKGLYQPTLSLNLNINTNWSDQFRRFEEGQSQVIPTGGFVEFNNIQAPVFQEVAIPVEVDFPFWDQYRNNRSTSLALNLSIPIFNRFQTKAQEQRAQINLQRAELTEIEQRNTLRQTIETAYNDAIAAAKTFEASQRQVEALEETFRVIENQYNIGAANFVEYQVASNNLFQARSDLLRFKYDFVFKMKILEFYEGKPITFEQ